MSAAFKTVSWSGLGSADCAAAGVTAEKQVSRMAKAATTRNFLLIRASGLEAARWYNRSRTFGSGPILLRLAALVDRIALLHPDDVKAGRQDQHAQPRESAASQCQKRRPEIRAFFERTASTVEHDVRILRQCPGELSELNQPLFGRTRSVENRSGNVRAFVQGLYAHVDYGRIGIFFLPQLLDKIGRLDGLLRGPRIIKTGGRQDGGTQQYRDQQARGGGRLLRHFEILPFYFLDSARCRCNLSAVVRNVSGTFLLIVSFFKSSGFNIGSKFSVTSSGALPLFKRFRTTA